MERVLNVFSIYMCIYYRGNCYSDQDEYPGYPLGIVIKLIRYIFLCLIRDIFRGKYKEALNTLIHIRYKGRVLLMDLSCFYRIHKVKEVSRHIYSIAAYHMIREISSNFLMLFLMCYMYICIFVIVGSTTRYPQGFPWR